MNFTDIISSLYLRYYVGFMHVQTIFAEHVLYAQLETYFVCHVYAFQILVCGLYVHKNINLLHMQKDN